MIQMLWLDIRDSMHADDYLLPSGPQDCPDLLFPFPLVILLYLTHTMQALAYTPHPLLVRLLHTSPRGQHKNTITTHGHLALTPEQGAWTE